LDVSNRAANPETALGFKNKFESEVQQACHVSKKYSVLVTSLVLFTVASLQAQSVIADIPPNSAAVR